jgi:serine/threonine protein kinase
VLDPAKISSETQGQQTNTGSILGTPHYMSFEQAMSDKGVDHRTDIWAMGVMVFEALTGRRPLVYDTLGQMYAGFLQGSVPSIREFVPDLPRDMADVLDRCLAKERDQRHADLGPLVEVLEKYSDPSVRGAATGGVVVEAPVSAPVETAASSLTASVGAASGQRRSRTPRLAFGLLALVIVGGAGAGTFALTRHPTARAQTPDLLAPSVTTPSVVAPAAPPPATSEAAVASTPGSAPVTSHAARPRVAPGTPRTPPSADVTAPHPTATPTKQGIYETPPY